MKYFLILSFFCIIVCSNAFCTETTIDTLERDFINCSNAFKKMEQKCPESWSMKCYDHLMSAHKTTQQCFRKTAIELFEKFYGLSNSEAQKKIDDFNKFIYDQYLFIFSETDFCKKNNCGISLYLYSEYTTTEQLQYYVNKIIRSISARN